MHFKIPDSKLKFAASPNIKYLRVPIGAHEPSARFMARFSALSRLYYEQLEFLELLNEKDKGSYSDFLRNLTER